MKILTSPRPSPSPNSNPKKEKANLAVTKILWATHPTTFRGSERWEGVPSSGGQQEEEHRVVLQVQVEHYQKKSQDKKPKSKIPGLVPVDYESVSYSYSYLFMTFAVLIGITMIKVKETSCFMIICFFQVDP